jgi:hypothetical protein
VAGLSNPDMREHRGIAVRGDANSFPGVDGFVFGKKSPFHSIILD